VTGVKFAIEGGIELDWGHSRIQAGMMIRVAIWNGNEDTQRSSEED